MKCKFFCTILILILISVFLFQQNKKADVYIALNVLQGYNYEFSDTVDMLNTNLITIAQTDDQSYKWWEIEIENTRSYRPDLEGIMDYVTFSPFFIINNYGDFKKTEKELNKYRLHILVWKNEEAFVLPIKRIRYIIE